MLRGFLFALVLFLIQEWIRNFWKQNEIINSFKFELDHNLKLLDEFEDFLRKIPEENRIGYARPNYNLLHKVGFAIFAEGNKAGQ